MKIKRFLMMTLIAALAAATISFGTMAAKNSTVVVTPTAQQGFQADTQDGGTVTFIPDPAAAAIGGGNGALRLTTTASVDSAAQYTKETNTPLASITELSYYTKRNSGPEYADASFALGADLNGTSGGSTFLIYEPYLQQPPSSSAATGLFTFQDVDQGRLYSTQTVTCSHGTIQSGAGGFGPFYTLIEIKQICPNAVVNLFGVFIGTYNPSYDVEVDLLNFNGTTYNFEPDGTAPGNGPQTMEQCKNGGYASFTNPSFKNQGQCIKFVNSREKNKIRKN